MLYAGAASVIINPPVGDPVQGASVDQKADYIRDDMEANALCIGSDETRLLLISLDLSAIEDTNATAARQAIEAATGVPAANIVIGCTHQHSGPCSLHTNYLKGLNTAWLDCLHDWMVEVAEKAVAALKPAQIACEVGAVQVGWNRRLCWEDTTHSMHGDYTRPDFNGLEGPDDPQHTGIFCKDLDGNMIAILQHNTTHTTCFYGRNFFSADFPGASRGYLRELYPDLPVLFLNGAQGDVSIANMMTSGGRGGEEAMLRTAHSITGETLRLLHNATYHEDLPIAALHEELEVAVRFPTADHVAWARKVLRKVDAGEETTPMERLRAFGAVRLQDEFADNPVDRLQISALRIGELAIAAESCELYCQFGLDIKRRSPSQQTMIIGVANGFNGYCPTMSGVLGGGYSGEPIHWTRLEPAAGYKIVDTAARLLHQLW